MATTTSTARAISPLFVVTREFISGNLAGMTHTETTAVAWEVGEIVTGALGGCDYRIVEVLPAH